MSIENGGKMKFKTKNCHKILYNIVDFLVKLLSANIHSERAIIYWIDYCLKAFSMYTRSKQ